MPIGGADGIGINLNQPSDTESAGLGDDRIRSLTSSFQQLLDAEHNVPTAGGNSVGYHRFGSARPYYGTQSQVSSSGSDARIMVTSDTSRLFGAGSGGTVMLGAGPGALSIGSGVVFPQRHYWVEEVGKGVTNASGTTTITFPNSGYSGAPFVQVTTISEGGAGARTDQIATLTHPTATEVTVYIVLASTSVGLSTVSFFWRSLGTRCL